MWKAILFDLDGTLLDDPMTVFGPAFGRAFVKYFGPYVPAEKAGAAMRKGVEAMDANAGGRRTNEQIFFEVASVAMGMPADELKGHLGAFYAQEFPKLASFTRRLPEARPLVAWAFAKGLQVVIATGMQTPLSTVECRLAWAGVPLTEFPYTFIPTVDNMHASKPHPAYYQEVLAAVGRQPAECLMVGDDWDLDIAPATSIGIPSYWITERGRTPPATNALLVGQGTLADLWAWLKTMAQ